MKKINKIILIMAIILLAGGTALFAANQYYASDIMYNKNGTQITVEAALNELDSKIPYKITYDANGGSGSMGVGAKYAGQSYSVAGCAFTAPTGKYFKSWNTNASGTGTSYAPGTEYTADAGTTLYAIWESGYVAYSMGDTVTVGGEEFYVLEDSGATQESVKLITKYNLNTAGTAQENATYSTTACAFSSTDYWSSVFTSFPFNLNNIEGFTSTDAIGKARSYAQSKGATVGRLLTYEELDSLRTLVSSNTKVKTMLWGNEATDGSLNYWIGSASSASYVWYVRSTSGGTISNLYFSSTYYGVRPVLEISKSKIGV